MKNKILILLLGLHISIYCQVFTDTINTVAATNNLNQDTVSNPLVLSLPDSTLKDSVTTPVPDTALIVSEINPEKDSLTIRSTDSSLVQRIIPELKVPDFKLEEDINFFTLLQIIILLLLGVTVSKLIDFFSRVKKLKEKYFYLEFLITVAKIILWLIILYSALFTLIPDTDEYLLIIVFFVLVLFGVSLIPLLKNIVGGFYLSISDPFRQGDYISVGNQQGIVQKITWRFTTISSENKNVISIPNSVFLSEPIVKMNTAQKEQAVIIEYEFGFEYDAEKVIKIIYEASLSSPYSYSKLEPKVYLTKNNFVSKTRSYQLHVYIIDPKFVNKLKHSLNLIINKAIETLVLH